MSLEIDKLCVQIENTPILKDMDLTVPKGEVHAIMGPNGTGKSTLAKALAGHGDYEITSGDARLNGESIIGKEVDEIARSGLFMAFQYPSEIPGVTIANFIRAALQSRMEEKEDFDAPSYYQELYQAMDKLGIDRKFTSRSINEGFSGGEKKRCEILQLMMLQPSIAILDETDSGLDIDALQIVAKGVSEMRGADIGFLIITHYQRLLNYIEPDKVHVMWDGRIVRSGDKQLAITLEEKGYEWVKDELATA